MKTKTKADKRAFPDLHTVGDDKTPLRIELASNTWLIVQKRKIFHIGMPNVLLTVVKIGIRPYGS